MTLLLSIEQAPQGQPMEERTHEGGQTVIGRGADCDWCIDDPDMYISRRHCVISGADGTYQVMDASRGGLFIDGARTPLGAGNSAPLETGMRLRLGDVVIRVTVSETADRPQVSEPAMPPAQPSGGSLGFDNGFFSTPSTYEEPPKRPDTLPDPFDAPPPSAITPPAPPQGGEKPVFNDTFTLGDLSTPPPPVPTPQPAQDLFKTPPSIEPQSPPPPQQPPVEEEIIEFSFFDQPPGPSDEKGPPEPSPLLDPSQERPADASPEPGHNFFTDDPADADPRGLAQSLFGAKPAAPPANLAQFPPADQRSPAAERDERPVAQTGTQGQPTPPASPPQPQASAQPPQPQPVAPPPQPQPAATAPRTTAEPEAGAAPTQPGPTDAAIREAFFKGLGIDPARHPTDDPLAEMEALGKRYRMMIDGLVHLLRMRTEEKKEAVIPSYTTIGAANVNPLKSLASVNEAVASSVEQRDPAYLEPDAAIIASFRDLAEHNIRSWQGVQGALRRMIDRFDPEAFESKVADTSFLESLAAGGKSAKLWRLYVARYKEIAEAAENKFLGEVGSAFRDEYQKTKGD